MNNLSLTLDQLRALSLKNKILPNNSFDLPLLLPDPTLPSLDWKTSSEALQISTFIFGKRVQQLQQTVASMQAKQGRSVQQERKTRINQSIRSQLSDKNRISQQIQGQFESIYLTHLLKLPSLDHLLTLNNSLQLALQTTQVSKPQSSPVSLQLSEWLATSQWEIEQTREGEEHKFEIGPEEGAQTGWQNKQTWLQNETQQVQQKQLTSCLEQLKDPLKHRHKQPCSVKKNRDKEFLRVDFQHSGSLQLDHLTAACLGKLKFKRKRTIMVPVFIPSNYLSRNYFPIPEVQLSALQTHLQQISYLPQHQQHLQHSSSQKANDSGMLDLKANLFLKVKDCSRLSAVLDRRYSVGMNLIGLLHVASSLSLRLRDLQGDIQW